MERARRRRRTRVHGSQGVAFFIERPLHRQLCLGIDRFDVSVFGMAKEEDPAAASEVDPGCDQFSQVIALIGCGAWI